MERISAEPLSNVIMGFYGGRREGRGGERHGEGADSGGEKEII